MRREMEQLGEEGPQMDYLLNGSNGNGASTDDSAEVS